MPDSSPRANQRLRTRKDLLRAAARLLKAGKTPTLAEVAEEALVSRATAYRHFPSIEALLVEAPLDGVVPSPEELFERDDAPTDPVERVDQAEAALHAMLYANEAQVRLSHAHSTRLRVSDDTLIVRQNRRAGLIQAALAPIRERLDDPAYDRLCAALSLVFGPESMIVCQDVLGIDSEAARDMKRWAIEALVQAALKTSRR
jgi:AcrR family transcriptional regulator